MKTNKMVKSALFLAIGILLPMLFHQFGLGQAFLPMHIPVLLAGFLLGKKEGFLVGLVTPILSSALTGMPPMFPMVPIMTVELAVYGLFAGYLFRDKDLNIYVSLIITMAIGRVFAGVVVAFLAKFFAFQGQMGPWIAGSIAGAVPGIAIQLILIPIIVMTVEKADKKIQ